MKREREREEEDTCDVPNVSNLGRPCQNFQDNPRKGFERVEIGTVSLIRKFFRVHWPFVNNNYVRWERLHARACSQRLYAVHNAPFSISFFIILLTISTRASLEHSSMSPTTRRKLLSCSVASLDRWIWVTRLVYPRDFFVVIAGLRLDVGSRRKSRRRSK